MSVEVENFTVFHEQSNVATCKSAFGFSSTSFQSCVTVVRSSSIVFINRAMITIILKDYETREFFHVSMCLRPVSSDLIVFIMLSSTDET